MTAKPNLTSLFTALLFVLVVGLICILLTNAILPVKAESLIGRWESSYRINVIAFDSNSPPDSSDSQQIHESMLINAEGTFTQVVSYAGTSQAPFVNTGTWTYDLTMQRPTLKMHGMKYFPAGREQALNPTHSIRIRGPIGGFFLDQYDNALELESVYPDDKYVLLHPRHRLLVPFELVLVLGSAGSDPDSPSIIFTKAR
jgi:hypothetical protein